MGCGMFNKFLANVVVLPLALVALGFMALILWLGTFYLEDYDFDNPKSFH
jgi:hypothetical protein